MSRRKQQFIRKARQASGDVEKILPRRHAKGAGTEGAGTWQEDSRGQIRGQGHTCSLPMTPEKEARVRRWVSGK